MRYLLPLLLLLAPPVFAAEPDPSELCELLDYELKQGVDFGYITDKQRNEVYIRCLVNYS